MTAGIDGTGGAACARRGGVACARRGGGAQAAAEASRLRCRRYPTVRAAYRGQAIEGGRRNMSSSCTWTNNTAQNRLLHVKSSSHAQDEPVSRSWSWARPGHILSAACSRRFRIAHVTCRLASWPSGMPTFRQKKDEPASRAHPRQPSTRVDNAESIQDGSIPQGYRRIFDRPIQCVRAVRRTRRRRRAPGIADRSTAPGGSPTRSPWNGRRSKPEAEGLFADLKTLDQGRP